MSRPSKSIAILIAEVIAILIAVPVLVVTRSENVILTPAETIETAVREALGSSNRGLDRATAVSIDEGDEVGIIWTLSAEVSEQRTLSAKRDVAAVLRAIQGTGVVYGQVIVHGTFPIVGPLGGISEEPVVNAIYNRGQLYGIDWDTFPTEDVYLIADFVDLLFDFQE